MAQLYTFTADAASAVSDGVTTTANGATIVVGGAAPNKHALLRFVTDTIPDTEYPMEATLSVKSSAKGVGAVPDLALWASFFNGAITNADYGMPYSNEEATLRVPFSTDSNPLLDAAASVGSVGELPIPLRFIKAGTGARSDFEVRPLVPTAGATDTVTIHGAAAVAPADKPTLNVYTLTEDEASAADDDVNRSEYSLIDGLVGNPYRFYATGAQSFAAFAREAKPGRPVKASVMLDASAIGITQNAETLFGDGLSEERSMPTKAAVGGATAGGSISFNLTPEKCLRLLTGFLKITNTVTNGDGTYTYTFKVAKSQEVAAFTFVTKKGAFYKVYRGARLDNLTISVGLDSIVRASITVGALEEWTYTEADAGMDANLLMDPNAGYDTVTNGVWSFVDAEVSVSGRTDDCISNFSLEFGNSLTMRRGLNKQRAAKGTHVGNFGVMASFDTDFVNEKLFKNFFGVNAKAGPFKAGKQIRFDTIGFTLDRKDLLTSLSIQIPKGLFENVSDGIDGPGPVNMSWRSMALLDQTVGSPVVLTYTTPEPPTAFQASTDYIMVQPPEDQD